MVTLIFTQKFSRHSRSQIIFNSDFQWISFIPVRQTERDILTGQVAPPGWSKSLEVLIVVWRQQAPTFHASNDADLEMVPHHHLLLLLPAKTDFN